MEKVGITACEGSLDAQVAPRFGKAPCFLLINPENMDFEVVPNQQNLQDTQVAGVQAAAQLAAYKPCALLTGCCGTKAYHILSTAAIPVFLEVSGSVREAVKQFRMKKLTVARGPNATSTIIR